MGGWFAIPRDWVSSFGDIAKFSGRIIGQVYGLRVFRFLGEGLRQAGILIVSSTLVIWGLVFIIGLQCGIEGAYFNRSVGNPAYAGVFAAWCDLRELIPYAFGYMMAAKVGTGIVAELGSMRISDEIDALEVMGISSVTFLCATRLLAAWLVLPFVYIAAIGAGLPGVVHRGRAADRRGFTWRLPRHLLDVPEPSGSALQPVQGDGDGDRDRAGRAVTTATTRAEDRSASGRRRRSRWC